MEQAQITQGGLMTKKEKANNDFYKFYKENIEDVRKRFRDELFDHHFIYRKLEHNEIHEFIKEKMLEVHNKSNDNQYLENIGYDFINYFNEMAKYGNEYISTMRATLLSLLKIHEELEKRLKNQKKIISKTFFNSFKIMVT
jgi:hypothetical protein